MNEGLYDPACRDLAEHFLSDRRQPVPPAVVEALARDFQATAEGFLSVLDGGLRPPLR